MRRLELGEEEARLRLEAGTTGLAERVPMMSARTLVSRGQRWFLAGFVLLTLVCLVLVTLPTLRILVAIITALYVIAVVYRSYLFSRSSRSDVMEIVTDDEARAVADVDLPCYSILIPVYREASVVGALVDHIERLDYPVDRLQVLMLVEGDDEETLAAMESIAAGPQFRIVVVPPSEPRTKPKALNFGLTLARGEVVAVYDAEDAPDPLQLRRAAVALGRNPPEVACLQSLLSYSNVTQNSITRWFTIEYTMWFNFFLPGLSSMSAPLPLGGTSNHFRRDVLRAIGGWDPYNVTEDADLGIRLDREGFKVRVLASTTLEEANSDFVNWVKQRSRWYKGYLQTFLIHFRQPRTLYREIGLGGMLHLCVFVAGTPFLALMNPVFWVLTLVWFIAQPHYLEELFPAPSYYAALLAWVFGNFLMLYLTLLSSRFLRSGALLFTALSVPVYWVMMSIAALKAVLQLVLSPSFWEKTAHGLTVHPEPVGTAGPP